MSESSTPRWWPRTIAARLSLILFGGLLIAHGLSFALLFYERYEFARSMLMSNVEQDVVVAVNVLDRLSPAERVEVLPLLRRRTFHYRLDAGEGGPPLTDTNARDVAQRIGIGLGPHYPLTTNAVRGDPGRYRDARKPAGWYARHRRCPALGDACRALVAVRPRDAVGPVAALYVGRGAPGDAPA
ncbi:hypothetical protein ACFPOA_09035 [Lysobacter niabensis]|uniref:hypothetical protein n=1 Tax=Agrilutibacter niabensis TaxID=380628 RepID=UPI00361AC322